MAGKGRKNDRDELDRMKKSETQESSHRRRDVSPSLSVMSSVISGLEWDHSADVHVNPINDQLSDDEHLIFRRVHSLAASDDNMVKDHRYAYAEQVSKTGSIIDNMMRSRSLDLDRQIEGFPDPDEQRQYHSLNNLRTEEKIRKIAEFILAHVPDNNMPRGGSMHSHIHSETPRPTITDRHTPRPSSRAPPIDDSHTTRNVPVHLYSIPKVNSRSSSTQTSEKQSSYTHISTPRPVLVGDRTPVPVENLQDNFGNNPVSVHKYRIFEEFDLVKKYSSKKYKEPEQAKKYSSKKYEEPEVDKKYSSKKYEDSGEGKKYEELDEGKKYSSQKFEDTGEEIGERREQKPFKTSYTYKRRGTPRPLIVETDTPRPSLSSTVGSLGPVYVNTYSARGMESKDIVPKKTSYEHQSTPRPTEVITDSGRGTPRPTVNLEDHDKYDHQSVPVYFYKTPDPDWFSAKPRVTPVPDWFSSKPKVTPSPYSSTEAPSSASSEKSVETEASYKFLSHRNSIVPIPPNNSVRFPEVGGNISEPDTSLTEWLETGKTKSEIEYERKKRRDQDAIASEGSGSSIIMLRLQADALRREARSVEKYLKSRAVQTMLTTIPPKMVDKGTDAQSRFRESTNATKTKHRHRGQQRQRGSVAFFIPATTAPSESDKKSELSIYRRRPGAPVKPRQASIIEEDEGQDASYTWSDTTEVTWRRKAIPKDSLDNSRNYYRNEAPKKHVKIRRPDIPEVIEKYYSDDSRFVEELNEVNLTKALVTKKPSFISKSKGRQEILRNRRMENLESAALKRAKVEKMVEEKMKNKSCPIPENNVEMPPPEPRYERPKARDYRKSRTHEVKQQTQKIYVNLPEVIQKRKDEEKTMDKEVNRTLKEIYSNRLRERARRGDLNISMSQSVVSASNMRAYVRRPSHRHEQG